TSVLSDTIVMLSKLNPFYFKIKFSQVKKSHKVVIKILDSLINIIIPLENQMQLRERSFCINA
ncbi:MAG TPA: hypothetical protein PLI52_04855, partial [Prochlorococcaceae cyanobacterium AMR_MDS_5431]|nr:hypothetical protein [Prochlorococcaceae cyanobacterium AMR_MDS_5431]